jgi:hypothetical protein
VAIRLSTLRLAPSIITVGISSMLASLVSTALDLTIMCVTGMRARNLLGSANRQPATGKSWITGGTMRTKLVLARPVQAVLSTAPITFFWR